MPKIKYIEFSGTEHVIDVPVGISVMKGAVDNRLRGILAECGGGCSCGTCHVYVDPDWFDRLGPKTPEEVQLLEDVCDTRPNSRLSCQVKVTPEMEGLVVRMPAKQV